MKFPQLFSSTIIVLALGIASSTAAQPNHYEIDARIDPSTGETQAHLVMSLGFDNPVDTLAFLLHGDLEITSIEAPGLLDFHRADFQIPGSDFKHLTRVELDFEDRAESFQITWQYSGNLLDEHIEMGQAAITEQWMELPIEAMWVPFEESMRLRFAFDARIHLPDGFDLLSTGQVQKDSSSWQIKSSVPGPDVPLIASSDMRIERYARGEATPIEIYHAGSGKELVNYIGEHTAAMIDRYEDRFQVSHQADALRIALSPLERQFAHSYARPGLIALEHGIEPGERLLGLIAHEAAHLWWFNSIDTQSRHNFLNEAFAEYLSWMELGHVFGMDTYQERIDQAREATRDAPGFDEWTPAHNRILSYTKGPLLLHELRGRIGDKNFDRFLQNLLRTRAGTLEAMIDSLETVAGKDEAQWLQDSL